MYVPYEDKICVVSIDALNRCRCGGCVTLSIKDKSTGNGQYFEDWEIHCLKCGGFWYFPADDDCGRKYYTKEEVVKKWNDKVGRNK